MTQARYSVAINILPFPGGMEIIEYDHLKGFVCKQGSCSLELEQYNHMILDRGAFIENLNKLYRRYNIKRNAPATFVLPALYTKEIRLVETSEEKEPAQAIQSELGNTIVFQKKSPQISWVGMQGEKILYSAYIKDDIDFIIEACQSAKINLQKITLNYSALLKGLTATGLIQQQLEQREHWALLFVNNSRFFAAMLEGPRWFKTTERPLSIDKASSDRVMTEIGNDFNDLTLNRRFSKVVIINNTSGFDSATFEETLKISCPIMVVSQSCDAIESLKKLKESTENTKQPVINQKSEFPCTLEAIGGVFQDRYTEIENFKYFQQTTQPIDHTREHEQFLVRVVSVFFIAILFLSLIISGGLALLNTEKTLTLKRLNTKIETLSARQENIQFDQAVYQRFLSTLHQKEVSFSHSLIQLARFNNLQNVWINKLEASIPLEQKTFNAKEVLLSGEAVSTDALNRLRVLSDQGFLEGLTVVDTTLTIVPDKTASKGKRISENKHYHWTASLQKQFPLGDLQ